MILNGNANVRRVVLFDALTLPFASIKGSLLVPISKREEILYAPYMEGDDGKEFG